MRLQAILPRTISVIAAVAVSASFVAVMFKDSARTDPFGTSAQHIVVDNSPGGAVNWTHANSPQG